MIFNFALKRVSCFNFDDNLIALEVLNIVVIGFDGFVICGVDVVQFRPY